MANVVPLPRPVRPAPEPFGLYFRIGRNDHLEVANAVLSGRAAFSGIVVGAGNDRRHGDLKTTISDRRLEVVLDTHALELGTPEGFTDRLSELPWALEAPESPADFDDDALRRRADLVADFVVEGGYSAVLLPAHLIDTPDSDWLEVDATMASMLREALDSRGQRLVGLLYPLTISGAVFRDPSALRTIARGLRGLPIDAIWLRVNGFGSDASPSAFLHYLRASEALELADVPLVADKVGGMVGLGLLAFGAAGGLSHGLTMGERCDLSGLFRPPQGRPFAPAPRVYVAGLDMLLKREDASAFFHARGAVGRLACRDAQCCPRGLDDTIEKPIRHFLNQRIGEVGTQAQVPVHRRRQRFLDVLVRIQADNAAFSERLALPPGLWAKRLSKNRRRLENFLRVLTQYVAAVEDAHEAALPLTRVSREARR